MPLPKITFHNVSNSLTSEIQLSEDITKDTKIIIPNDSGSRTDAGSHDVIEIVTYEQMKKLLNEIRSQFNTWNNNYQQQINNINNAISSETQARQTAITAETNRAEGEEQRIETELRALISQETSARQSAISSEASTRSSQDSTLRNLIDQKVPTGTIIPVIRSLNGVKVSPPSYITSNYLKCDGSKISTSYNTLINYLYPPTSTSSGTETYISSLQSYDSYINRSFVMSVDDFSKLAGLDIRALFSEYMLPFGRYISRNYNNVWSLNLYGVNLSKSAERDLRLVWNEQTPTTKNGDDYQIKGVSGKDPNGYIGQNDFMAYILWTDHTNNFEKILKEEIFYFRGSGNIRTGLSHPTYQSYRRIDSETDTHILISSCNTMNTTSPYIGCRVALLPLGVNTVNYRTQRHFGKLYNLIEMAQAIGDFNTYLSGGNLVESNRLGRFCMSIGDFSRFSKMNEKILRNNFFHYGEQLVYNLWRQRQWIGVRGDGRLMSHNYNEYYPYNASSQEPFGVDGQTSSRYDVGTNIRGGYVTLIRIWNDDTAKVEKELIYVSYDKTTTYSNSDYGVISRNYPTFKLDTNPDELCLHDSYDYGATERTLYAYRLPLTHVFKSTPEYEDTVLYGNASFPSALDRFMLNYYRIKYNYEYSGGDTSISGIEYNPYGGVGRIACDVDDYWKFAFYHYQYTNSLGKKRYGLQRFNTYENNWTTHNSYYISSTTKFTRYQIRLNGISDINIYYYKTDSTWATGTISISGSTLTRIYKAYFQPSDSYSNDITKQAYVIDLRNNNTSNSSTVNNNTWSTGIIRRYYRNWNNPPITTANYVVCDQTFTNSRYGYFYVKYLNTGNSTPYRVHTVKEITSSSDKRLPNLNQENVVMSGGNSANIGQFVNSNVKTRNMLGDTINIENNPYHVDQTIVFITVEYWIKF